MAKIIDKVVQQKTTPKDKNVLWDNGENLNINRNGSWESITNSTIVKITYEDLKSLRDKGKLVSGQKYRIINYVTTCFKVGAISARHPFDVIVTAIDESHLSEEAIASPREGDTYFKDQNLYAWKIWYCLDNDEERFDWIKNLPFKIRIKGTWDNDPLVEADAFYIGQFSMGDNFRYNGYVVDKSVKNHIVFVDDWVEVKFDNGVSHSVRNGMVEEPNSYILLSEEDFPKGVIYRMIDEYNNDLPYDFKNIMFFNQVSGRDWNFYNVSTNYDYITQLYTPTFFNTYETELAQDKNYVSKDMSLTTAVYNNTIDKTIERISLDVASQTLIPTSIFIDRLMKNSTIHSNVRNFNIWAQGERLMMVDNLEIDVNTTITPTVRGWKGFSIGYPSHITNKRISSNITSIDINNSTEAEEWGSNTFKYYGLQTE